MQDSESCTVVYNLHRAIDFFKRPISRVTGKVKIHMDDCVNQDLPGIDHEADQSKDAEKQLAECNRCK